MKITCKTLFAFSTVILFFFLAQVSSAQSPQSGIKDYINLRKAKKEFNQKYKMGEMMPFKMLGKTMIFNSEYGFEILLKDSTRQKIYTAIQFDTILRKTYLVVVNKKFPKSDPEHRNQRIYPDQTLQISRTNFSDKKIIGISKDSCWMFKIISGAINTYSYISEEPGPTFEESTIIGIQLSDGPILKYNVENLKQMVGNDADALESIESKDYLRAIKKYNRDVQKSAKK
jgi:hypothetical protein